MSAVEADGVGQVADAPLHLARMARRVEADDPRLAAGRLGQPEQHEDGRGLAGAVLAEQPEDLARPDLEVELVDGDERVVALRQAARLDDGSAAVGSRAVPRSALARSAPAVAEEDPAEPGDHEDDQRDADRRRQAAGLDRDPDVASRRLPAPRSP